jgi:hypothetical protein
MGREYIAPVPAVEIPPQPTVPVDLQLPSLGHLVDRFVTMVQLGVGVLALITSNWFQFAADTNPAFAEAGISLRIPSAVDRYGWVLLGANVLFLALTTLWAYTAMRRRRWAFYIPFVGDIAFFLAVLTFSYLIGR